MAWQFAAVVEDVGTTSFASAFEPSGDQLWTLENKVIELRDFPALTDAEGRYANWSGDPIIGGFYATGVAVDADGFVWLIGWHEDGGFGLDEHQVYRFSITGEDVYSATRYWRAAATAPGSPGAGHVPAIVYNPVDDRIYFHHTTGSFSGFDGAVRSLAAGGGASQSPTTNWTSVGSTGNSNTGLTLTSDDVLMWKSYPDGTSVRVNTLTVGPDPESVDYWLLDFIDHGPGPGSSLSRYDLAHDPDDPTAIFYWDSNLEKVWRVPSDLSAVTEVSPAEITGATNPELRGVSMSHDGTRGLVQISEPTVSGGNWYYWQQGTTGRGRWGRVGWPAA